jgi:N-acetylmuramoyl-L-alanine amidase
MRFQYKKFQSILVLALFLTGNIFALNDFSSTDSYIATAPKPKRNQAYVPPSNADNKPRILIDPGHGGEDFGTYSLTIPRIHEKHLALTTSGIVREGLIRRGYKVVMTRRKDVFITLERRPQIAKEFNCDLFVSIHYNSAPNKSANGVEIFYFEDANSVVRTAKSQRLGKAVLGSMLTRTKANSRGVKKGNFAVIRETHIPAILIECGFLTNAEELANIKKPAYIKALADGIVDGIDRYVRASG